MATFEQMERREAQRRSAKTLREGVPADSSGNRDCKLCKHHCNDLEDYYCGHPVAMKLSQFGQNTRTMHALGLCDVKRAQLWEGEMYAAPMQEGAGVISA